MILRLATVLTMIVCTLNHAAAEDFTEGMDEFSIANEAGGVIGGARNCGYLLDMGKVEAFIQSRVAVMSGSDRETFRTAVDIRDYQLTEMAENERKAQCMLQRELARKYGFSK